MTDIGRRRFLSGVLGLGALAVARPQLDSGGKPTAEGEVPEPGLYFDMRGHSIYAVRVTGWDGDAPLIERRSYVGD